VKELQFEETSPATFDPPPPPAKGDYVTLIETAYDLASDDRSWLRAVVHAAFPIIDRGLGASGFFWDLSHAGKHQIGDPTFVGCDPALHAGFRAGAARLTSEQAQALYVRNRPTKIIVGSEGFPRAYAAFRSHMDSQGFVLISAADFGDRGCSIAAPQPAGTRASPALGQVLDRVARHIVAGMRLRRTLRASPTDGVAPEAVLDSKGRLLHAEAPAKARRERGGIVEGARRLLASRKARRARPEQAVEFWRALVLGRWSLVDHTDSDGKRFLLARKNAPHVREPAALTEDERRAAALFALLGSVKLVAYELGLAPSTISQELKSASRKLGCRDRAELAALLQPRPTRGGA